MMMNDFGVPMSDAEMSMQAPGAIKPHEQMMANSGVEMNWNPFVVAAAVSAAGSIIGGAKSASAAKKQANLQNEATQRQFEYNTKLWEMGKERTVADHAFLTETIDIKKRNEQKIADYRDAINLSKYNYDLKIHKNEQESLDKQFAKSQQLYAARVNQNVRSAQLAAEDEHAQFQELQQEVSFENEDLIIETMLKQGELAALGQSGQSLGKAGQAIAASSGYRQAQMAQTIMSGSANLHHSLREIAADKGAADLQAWSQKMLKPGKLPPPIKPLETPIAEFQYPDPIQDYDFGPKPVLGAQVSASAAASQAWAGAIQGVASAAGSAFNAYGSK